MIAWTVSRVSSSFALYAFAFASYVVFPAGSKLSSAEAILSTIILSLAGSCHTCGSSTCSSPSSSWRGVTPSVPVTTLARRPAFTVSSNQSSSPIPAKFFSRADARQYLASACRAVSVELQPVALDLVPGRSRELTHEVAYSAVIEVLHLAAASANQVVMVLRAMRETVVEAPVVQQ